MSSPSTPMCRAYARMKPLLNWPPGRCLKSFSSRASRKRMLILVASEISRRVTDRSSLCRRNSSPNEAIVVSSPGKATGISESNTPPLAVSMEGMGALHQQACRADPDEPRRRWVLGDLLQIAGGEAAEGAQRDRVRAAGVLGKRETHGVTLGPPFAARQGREDAGRARFAPC